MIKDKVNSIIESLVIATNKGQLHWLEKDPKSKKRPFFRDFISTGEDNTSYEIEVKFLLVGDKWRIDQSPSLWIKSENLPNGSFYVYGGDYDVKTLRDIIRDKYCQDMNPSEKIVEDALDSISKGISLSLYREGKLSKILNEDNGNK